MGEKKKQKGGNGEGVVFLDVDVRGDYSIFPGLPVGKIAQ